jgi:hypothetical protein
MQHQNLTSATSKINVCNIKTMLKNVDSHPSIPTATLGILSSSHKPHPKCTLLYPPSAFWLLHPSHPVLSLSPLLLCSTGSNTLSSSTLPPALSPSPLPATLSLSLACSLYLLCTSSTGSRPRSAGTLARRHRRCQSLI